MEGIGPGLAASSTLSTLSTLSTPLLLSVINRLREIYRYSSSSKGVDCVDNISIQKVENLRKTCGKPIPKTS